MNASSSSRQYHYESQGITHGPVSGRALRALAASGKIAPTDTVWEIGSEKRYRATKVRGLFGDAGADAESKGTTAETTGRGNTTGSSGGESSGEPPDDDIVTATLILDDSPTNASPFAPVTPAAPVVPAAPVTGNPFATTSPPPTRPVTPGPSSAPTTPSATKPASSSASRPAPKTTTQPLTTTPAKTAAQNSTKSATRPAIASAQKPATTPAKDVVLATALRDVFISYSSKDKPIADAICAILEQERIRCWIAPRDIRPGQEYAESILNAINASRMMVIVLSASSNASPHVLREVERGVSKGIPVIPFRVEDIKPSKSLEFFLSAPHWLDALTTPLEDHIHKLVTVAKTILETQPDDPDRSLGGATRLVQMRSRPQRTWLKPVGMVGAALALMLALFMLWRSAGPNPLDAELAEFKRNLDLGNGSIVFLNQHATSRFPEWLKLAEKGNPIGQLFVGRCYQEGLVVEPDAAVALEWLKKSAHNGNSFAQVAIAYGYSDGIGGMERNVSESLRWNTLAAEQGNSTAMRNIGFLYTEGIQGKPELDKALEWFRKAAEAGNTAAMRKVADFYRSGTGVEKDEAEAEKWVARALAAGDVWLIGKNLGDEFGKQFAAYLDAKATAARKSEAVTTLQAKLPEIQQMQLNGVVAIFSASDFYVSITGLEDLPKTDPLRTVHNELVTRLITVYSAASNSEKANHLADFTRAVDLRLASLYEDKNYVELAKIWEQCYRNIRYDQLRKNDEWNSLVRQIRFLTTGLIKQGQRKEAEQLIEAITKQCQVWLKDRPWDWYLKDAYTGVCFEAADAWFETGDVELMQPLLLQAWTIRLRQFGKEDWLTRLTGRLPRKGQVPSGATDEERDFFERFTADKSKEDKSKSGSSTTAATKTGEGETAESKKRDSGMKRFTVPIDFAGKKYPFFVYVMTGPRGYAEVQDQFRWVEEIRGGKVPQEVRDSFRRLNEIAKENNVDFMELTLYALGTATTEGGGTGGSGTSNSGTKVESPDNSSKSGGTNSSDTNSSATSTPPSGISPAGTTGSEKGASEKGASEKGASEKGASEKGASEKPSAFGPNNGFSNPMGGPKTKMNSNGRTPPPEKKRPDNTNGKRPSPPTKTKR